MLEKARDVLLNTLNIIHYFSLAMVVCVIIVTESSISVLLFLYGRLVDDWATSKCSCESRRKHMK